MNTQPEPDDHNEYEDECSNCGGSGFIYMCMDEIGCIDPESGCDDCERRCDWCNSKPKRETAL
jgi:hypothetical protein